MDKPGMYRELPTTDTGKALCITFIGLPVSQTELSLSLEFEDDIVRTLDLKDGNGDWITVQPGHKLYVNATVGL